MQYFLFEISQLRLSPTLEMTTEGKVSVRFGRKERKATEWRLFAFKRNCANYKSFSALPLIPPLSKGRLTFTARPTRIHKGVFPQQISARQPAR